MVVNDINLESAQEKWVNAIKSCGQSLIDNADEIAGHYNYQTGTEIFIRLRPNEIVEIEVSNTYVPMDISKPGHGVVTT